MADLIDDAIREEQFKHIEFEEEEYKRQEKESARSLYDGGRARSKELDAKSATYRPDEELTAMDWLLIFFCNGIAWIYSIVLIVQGNPKGMKMLTINIVLFFIALFINIVVVVLIVAGVIPQPDAWPE